MADPQLAIIDPSGRLIAELATAAAGAAVALVAHRPGEPVKDCAAVLVGPALAADLPPQLPSAPERWIVG